MRLINSERRKGDSVLFVLFSFVLISLYLLPAIVAFVRDAPDTGSVMVLNLFFGWTFVGWVVALAMAARSRTDGSVNVLVNPHIQSGYLFPTPPAPAFQHPSQPQFQPQAAPQ